MGVYTLEGGKIHVKSLDSVTDGICVHIDTLMSKNWDFMDTFCTLLVYISHFPAPNGHLHYLV